MAYILFEDEYYLDLLPLTFTRPIYDLRSGIFTFRERWKQHLLNEKVYNIPRHYLQPIFRDISLEAVENAIWINGRFVPNTDYLNLIKNIAPQTVYIDSGGAILAANFSASQLPNSFEGTLTMQLIEEIGLKIEEVDISPLSLKKLSDIFSLNGQLIAKDFEIIANTKIRTELKDPYTMVYGRDNLFIEEGANVRAAVINAEDGPIYIAKGANVQEGALIKRPHAICENASVSMGAKLRGDSTIGPYCKAGGEITNSVLMGYSSKAHDGYLGNSILGYWCNMGADSNNSNLKNNYSNPKQWSYRHEQMKVSDTQFCGLTMGDHSKCGINSMFNTGTVIGVFANIFGDGYPPKFIPSFSWGGVGGMTTYNFEKACEVAEKVMNRRKIAFTDLDRNMLKVVFEMTKKYRH